MLINLEKYYYLYIYQCNYNTQGCIDFYISHSFRYKPNNIMYRSIMIFCVCVHRFERGGKN